MSLNKILKNVNILPDHLKLNLFQKIQPKYFFILINLFGLEINEIDNIDKMLKITEFNSKDDFLEFGIGAAEIGNIDSIKLIISKMSPADLNIILDVAAEKGEIDIVKLMIENGADYIQSALVSAARNGNIDIVKLLIKNGDFRSGDPMIAAAEGGSSNATEIIKVLFDNSYGEEITDSDFYEIMKKSLENKNPDSIEIIKMMIKNTKYYYYPSLLKLAIRSENPISLKAVEYLIQNGLIIDESIDLEINNRNPKNQEIENLLNKTEKDYLKIIEAVESKDLNLLKKIVQDYPYYNYNPGLIQAAKFGYLDLVEFLIQNGADDIYYSIYEIISLYEEPIKEPKVDDNLDLYTVIDFLLQNHSNLINSQDLASLIETAAISTNPNLIPIIKRFLKESNLGLFKRQILDDVDLYNLIEKLYEENRIDSVHKILFNFQNEDNILVFSKLISGYQDYEGFMYLLNVVKSNRLKYCEILEDEIYNFTKLENNEKFNSLLKLAESCFDKEEYNNIVLVRNFFLNLQQYNYDHENNYE